jgi:signal peptidase II
LKTSQSRDLVLFGVAAAVLILDQLSKNWVRTTLTPGVPWTPTPLLRPVLSFTYITNTGASFGLFPQLASVYALVAIAVGLAIIYFRTQLSYASLLVWVSLGLQLGGSLGNLVDRLLRQGQVTDFIDLNFWPLQEWPVFNVADSSVVVGAVLLAAYMLLEQPDAPSSNSTVE